MEANLIDSLGDDAARLVEIRFRPFWEYIEAIRHLGRSMCQTTFGTSAVGERVQLVIQEALENAVKYSEGGPHNDLEIAISSSSNSIEISVTSKPNPQDLDSLRTELNWISEKDPETAYLEAFKRAAETPGASARLGLARMRFEGKVELSIVETSDGRIRLNARGAI